MTRSLSFLLPCFLFLFLSSLVLVLLPIDAACTCTPSPSPPTCPSSCLRCEVSGSIQANCNCDPGCGKGCSSGYNQVLEGGCGFLWLWDKNRCYRTDTYPTYTCTECSIGKYGNTCQYTCPGTSGNVVCSGAGLCSSGINGTGVCHCNADATGFACQYTRSITCNGNGTPQYSGACVCDKGYTGTNCENCDKNYYHVNGKCVYCDASVTCSGYGVCLTDATCKCYDGFTGTDCRACVTNDYAWPACKN